MHCTDIPDTVHALIVDVSFDPGAAAGQVEQSLAQHHLTDLVAILHCNRIRIYYTSDKHCTDSNEYCGRHYFTQVLKI